MDLQDELELVGHGGMEQHGEQELDGEQEQGDG